MARSANVSRTATVTRLEGVGCDADAKNLVVMSGAAALPCWSRS